MAAAHSDNQELNSLQGLPGKSNLPKCQVEILINHLTVVETYFFRDNKFFDAFRVEMRPELIGRRRGKNQHLRIWSAVCCTGEEPYSIAGSLREPVVATKQKPGSI
jgi:chemotaxis protein methyltransferase CheR